MDLFGDLDDDMFAEQKPAREPSHSVTLLEAEPKWFRQEPAPEGLELLRLKFVADRLYKEKRYAEAAEAYASSIALCPPTNLGFLRDIVDGATRSLLRSSKSGSQDDAAYGKSIERLDQLENMASCEDHRYSLAASRWLTQGRVEDLHVMIESEPHSANLWKVLGRRYEDEGRRHLALCCYIKAACNFRTSVHECKERFREENSTAAREMNQKIAEISPVCTNGHQLIDRINGFYASLAETRREPEKTFEEYWFPPKDILCYSYFFARGS